jgi:hypothetical protein
MSNIKTQELIEVINFKGKIYIFKKDDDQEPYPIFLERIWWIVANLHKSDSIKDLHNMSHIWACVRFYKTSYDKETMDKLSEITSLN